MADTSFQIDIAAKADGVDSAASSLDALTTKLTSAGAASEAAAAAVKAGEQAYSQIESGADKAAKALEKINIAATAQQGKLKAALDAGDAKGVDAATAKLEALSQRQNEASAKANAAKTALASEAAALDKLKASAASAAAEQEKVSKTIDEAKKASDAAAKAEEAAAGTGSSKKIAAGLGNLGGPLGAVGQKVFATKEAFEKLGTALGDSGPYVIAAVGAAALVAGMAALAAAAVSATVAIGAWAVGLADGNRSAALLSQGLMKSVEGGKFLDTTIGNIQNHVPLAKEELMSMADGLAKSGLKGDALADALGKAAVKAAQLKWGPDFEKQMLSLDNQTARFKDNIAGVFGGLKIDGLLKGLAKLVALFNMNSDSGRAIKSVFESLFQPLIDGVTAFVPKMVSAFIQFEILVLKALIAIKPFGSKIVLLGEILGGLALILVGAIAAAIAFVILNLVAIAFAISVAIAAVVAIGVAFVYVTQQIGQFGASVVATIAGIPDWITGKFNAVVAFLQGLSLSDIGANLINGLVEGIKAAGGAVLGAITGVVSGAIDGAKALLKIKSPSQVFAEIGMNTGAGMAQGVDKSAGDVQGSMADMVSPPTSPLEAQTGVQGAKSGASASSSGGATITGNTFTFNGVQGAEDAEQRFGALLTRLLEGDAAQVGAEVPA